MSGFRHFEIEGPVEHGLGLYGKCFSWGVLDDAGETVVVEIIVFCLPATLDGAQIPHP